jgi:hypothetical protein
MLPAALLLRKSLACQRLSRDPCVLAVSWVAGSLRSGVYNVHFLPRTSSRVAARTICDPDFSRPIGVIARENVPAFSDTPV